MLVSRVYPTHRPGGMPHVCQDRAESLVKAGHEVHVVTTRLSAGGIETINGVEVNYTNSPPEKWSKQFAVCCEAMHEHLKPDVLHLDSFDRENPWWVGKRTTITMHGFGFGAFLTRWNRYRSGSMGAGERGTFASQFFDQLDVKKEADALAKASVVIGVSRWEWRMLRDQCGLRQAKLVCNPIAPCFFDPPPMHDDGPTQRTYFLCAAVSQGETRGFDVCRAAAKLAGVELRTAEKWDRRSMPAIYDGAKALLLPTAFAQGYDLSVAEARARGCPAILSPTGSYLDEAREWDTFTEIGDAEGLSVILKNWQQPTVHVKSADEHRPEKHVESWLAAVA